MYHDQPLQICSRVKIVDNTAASLSIYAFISSHGIISVISSSSLSSSSSSAAAAAVIVVVNAVRLQYIRHNKVSLGLLVIITETSAGVWNSGAVKWPAWSGWDPHSINKTGVTHLPTQNSRGSRFHTFCSGEAFFQQPKQWKIIDLYGGRRQRTLPRKPIPAVAFSLDLRPFLPPSAVLQVLPRQSRLCPRRMTRLGISQCWQVCQDWLSKI